MKPAIVVLAAAAAAFVAGGVAAADGQAVYGKSCAVCHAKGVAGAAKLGDKSKWEPILKKGGADVLAATVVGGKGKHPPKGGNASLSDADIKAAVEYMIGQVK